jgi:hypothetical protein
LIQKLKVLNENHKNLGSNSVQKVEDKIIDTQAIANFEKKGKKKFE